MSDLNDLIHTNARIAFQQGEQREQERIIKLLEKARESKPCQCDDCGDHVWQQAIELIKGEQK